jgi:hypothetical protein
VFVSAFQRGAPHHDANGATQTDSTRAIISSVTEADSGPDGVARTVILSSPLWRLQRHNAAFYDLPERAQYTPHRIERPMKHIGSLALLLLAITATAQGQTLLADNYDVTGNGDGFLLGAGLNSGINPPETRLTGSLAGDLRYIATNPAKVSTAYTITNGKFQVAAAQNSGRVTLSNDGFVPYDFGPALGASTATPLSPVIYELRTTMANAESGNFRFSFGIGTVEADVTFWDFGVQLYRAAAANDFYTIQRRIDTGSSGVADINAPITTLGAGTYGTELDFLLRVTDAGPETTAFNSRVQVSLDGGSTFIYDTFTDLSLPNGWRLDGANRYLIWDIAGTGVASTGFVTYDNLSVVVIPEPGAAILGLIGALVAGSFRRVRDKVRCD